MTNRIDLQNLINTSNIPDVVNLAKAELQKLDLQEKSLQGDIMSQSLLMLKDTIDAFKKTNTGTPNSNIDLDAVKKLIKDSKISKITFKDLDDSLQNKLSGQVQVKLTLANQFTTGSGKQIKESQLIKPLFQKLLSDFVAKNNVYLYGAAGTGKTYIVEQVAKFLGYNYVEVNCNQFTSPLDLVGGQTIEGYQKGKLEMAWTNVNVLGDEMKGAILCLDELPKLDPNTAGVLNAALAKIKLGIEGDPAFIYNGKGEKIYKKNIFVVATGNTRLNETSTDYEANFKQDLSLQDRFVGSTYEVLSDYESEFNELEGFAFIFLYMIKIREIIQSRDWASKAFVSFRILISLRDTYIVSREYSKQIITPDTSITSPKTLKMGIDSFLSLFSPTQRQALKDLSEYDDFINIIATKDSLPMTELNTKKEITDSEKIIAVNKENLRLING